MIIAFGHPARAKARAVFIALAITIALASLFPLFAQQAAPAGDAVQKPGVEKKEDKKQSAPIDADKHTDASPAGKNEGAAGDGEKRKEERAGGVFTIGEIVVKGESIAHIDEAATTTEVTNRDLKEHGSRTLDEALVTVPGVQVEQHQKGHMRVKMRGFDQDKIAILVDGVPVADVYSTDIDITDLTVKNISRIYVNRGVSSALYGASGAVGSINIVTKKPPRLFAQGGGEYGMYNNYTFDAAVGGPYKGFYGWITGSVQNSDGFEPSRRLDRQTKLDWFNKLIRCYVYGVNPAAMNVPGPFQYLNDTGTWNNTGSRKYNASGKLGYELTDRVEAGVEARFSYGSNKTNTYQPRCVGDFKINTLTWNEPVFFPTLLKELKKAPLVNRSFVWPEKYSFSVSPYLKFSYQWFSMKLQGFYSRTYAKQVGYFDSDHIFMKDNAAVLSQDASFFNRYYEIKTYSSYGIQAYPSFRIASWNRLTLGVLWRGDEMDARQQAKSPLESPDVVVYYGTSPYKVNYLKAYFVTVAVEDEISIRDRLKITAGVSYDAQNFVTHKARSSDYPDYYGGAYIVKHKSMIWGTRDSFNPVAGVVYDAVPDLLRLKTAFSMKTRFPTLGEYEKVADPTVDRGLKPERSYNFNAGPVWYFLDRTITLEADYFFSIIRNRIEKIAGGEEPPVNIDRVDTHGLETVLSYRKKQVGDVVDIEGSLAYTYMNVLNRDNSWEETVNKGERIENTPAHQVIADVRFRFKTGTSFGVWGTALIDQIMYAQQVRPPAGPPSFYSRRFFTAVRLHDSFSLNARVAQEIWDHFTLYVLFKNILDDYNPDPFNPGPGFMFYGGFEAKL